jgi:hypothetical protein
MATLKKLPILQLVTALAIGRRHLLANCEAMVIATFLVLGRLMAIQATDALLSMDAQLVLVHDRMLLLGMALGTFPRCADKGRARLGRFGSRPQAIDQEAGKHQPKPDDHGDEDGAKGHGFSREGK